MNDSVSSPANTGKAPQEACSQHTRGCSPCKTQKLRTSLSTDVDLCTFCIYEFGCVLAKKSGQYERHSSGQGSGGAEHYVDTGAAPAREENAEDCESKSNGGECKADAVDYRHDARNGLECTHATFDFRWPTRLRHVDQVTFAAIWLQTRSFAQVEIERERLIAAASDVSAIAIGH